MSNSSSNRTRVMVVDDEAIIRQLLRRHIQSLGYDVIVAESGEEALIHAANFNPSLIFLDFKMPGMGGMECLRQLRILYPSTPVVMLTAVLEHEAVLGAVHTGAQEYLFKPIDLETVTRVVEMQLSRR